MILNKKAMYIIPLVIAVIATAIIFFSIKSMTPTATVIVANQNLKVGTVIGQEHLTTITLPPKTVPSTAFTSGSDVIGKTIINGPVVRGDMIRSEHLSLDGSLMAILKSYAPEGWTALELPQGAGMGLKGLRKGDSVNIYGEIPAGGGMVVGEVVKNAIVLFVPDGEDQSQYIIAVPDNYAPSIAEAVVRGKPIALSLPSVIKEETTVPQVENPEEE